jgi:hypothetical protein
MPSKISRRTTLDGRALGIAFASALIAAACLSAATPIQAEQRVQSRCPAGYGLLDPVCVNQATGDVVTAEPAVAFRTALEAGCAPGYWRLADHCLNSTTGDVELVDLQNWPKQRAEVR